MIKRRRFPKIFFGWWTVIGGGILSFWGTGYYFFGFAALFKPIASELGFSRAVTSVAASIGRLEGGFEAPVVGWITDKLGPRGPVFVGVFIAGLGMMLMYFVNSLWTFYVIWGVVVGAGNNIGLTTPLTKAVTDWFVRKRGLALGIRIMFVGSAGMVMLPLIAWLINTQGWRMTCVIGGVVMLLVGLPLAWFCFKPHRPEYYGLLPDGATVKEEAAETSQMIDRGVAYADGVGEVEFTVRQALRTGVYWLFTLSAALGGMVPAAIYIHSIPLLTDRGLDPIRAAGLMGIVSVALIPASFIGGIIADRVPKSYLRFVVAAAYLLQAVGIILFLLNPSIPMFVVWFILNYSGIGLMATIRAAMLGRYFGRKGFASIQGISTLVLSPFGMIAPIYAGWIYDTTGNYITAFVVFAVSLALGAVFMFFASPPQPPARVTDVRQFV